MAAEIPKFIVLTGPEEGQEFSLKGKTRFRLGRFEDNDIVFTDTSVSRHHATVVLKDGKWLIRDENSRNNTWVNETGLKPTSEATLTNLDVIKLGVYEIRYVDQESKVGDVKKEGEHGLEMAQGIIDEAFTDKGDLNGEAQDSANNGDEKIKMGKGWFVFITIVALFCLLGIGLYIGFEHGKDEVKDDVSQSGGVEEDVGEKNKVVVDANIDSTELDAKPQPEETPESNFTPIVPDQVLKESVPAEFFVFLDVKTTPLAATVIFQDKRLGLAPLKENIKVEVGKVYDIYADYELRDINDIYRKKASFTVKPDTDIVELKIDADIGVLKILQLPPKTEFYLEGYYDYDQEKANPVKITDIVYGKPIYLPFGRYVVQLKEKIQVAGSTNFTTEIRFERTYEVNTDHRVLEVTISEKDLKLFPAIIHSVPNNAQVFLGEELIGPTPFDGKLPIGKNEIKIKKDGFFTKTIAIEMNKNAIYETTVTLETSKMGELINKAKEELRHEQYDEGINTLVTALKYGGSTHEKAQTYYLLGDTYLQQKKYEQATPYFEKAKADKGFNQRATLGLVKTLVGLNQNTGALKEIVQVLAMMDENTENSLRNEANDVFKLVSPNKSVLYLYTDPPGATVFVNDRPLSQLTPLILSDLALGNYRLKIEKAGFETFTAKQNVRLGEFVMVKIKLNARKN